MKTLTPPPSWCINNTCTLVQNIQSLKQIQSRTWEMVAFCASWKLVGSENFHEYLTAVGLDEEMVQVGNVLKPKVTISQEGDKVVLKTVTSVSSKEISGKLDEEFDDTTLDERICKSVLYLDGDKLVYVQKWDDKQSTATREVKGDQMITTLELNGVVAVLTYERV
uniref:Fatty acid binding protein 7, brain, b n=1 Tax=Astyanax mexicanus TaxID=7994 RepID=A0A3B1JE89_ASTMX